MNLPARAEHLKSISDFSNGWDSFKLAIRPECRNDSLIDRARTAADAYLYDCSINYFWNMTINDLHKKIVAYGIDYFANAINWEGKPLKNISDLREVKDYQIISGAFALGIIGEEAHFFLQQCRELRNNFSVAHYPMGDLDKLEAFNFIKNCIKYVLTYDLPSPGLQIRDLVDTLSLDRFDDIEEISAIIVAQSSKIHGAILHSLFSNYIKSDCNPNLKHNINLLAPYLWALVDDEVKATIGQKYASLRDRPTIDAAGEALAFLKQVNGVNYIPESFKDVIFRKHAKLLIDAHMGWNNFHNEPACAKDLASLGSEVPISALETYVKAILLSFLGNRYNVATGAQCYNEKIIQGLSQSGIRMLFKVLKSDLNVVAELTNYWPASRLKDLMVLIQDKTMYTEQTKDFEMYRSLDINQIKDYFNQKYWKLAERK